jgi:hypothetical protein
MDYIAKNMLVKHAKVAGGFDLENKNEDCEHRHFHFQAVIQKNAKIRISPECLFIM